MNKAGKIESGQMTTLTPGNTRHWLLDAGGFSMVELVIVLAVIGILLSIAVPPFRDFLRNNQLASVSHEYVASVNFARSEAVRRGSRVTICRSATGAACAGSGNWDQGWIVFTDPNNNATVDAGEEVLQVHRGVQGGSTLVGNINVVSRITLDAQGRPGQAGTVTLCNTGEGIDIILSPMGRLRTAEAAVCP